MKGLIYGTVIAALGGGGALVVHQTGGAADSTALPAETLYTVTRGDLRVTITENGTLMAKNSEKITTKTRRGGTITFLIEEGATVAQDEVLCRLDTTDLEQRKQQLNLEIVQTQADLDTAKTELAIQISENEATIEKAAIALEKAKKELERYLDGDAPKERRQLEVAIKEARTNHSRAKKKYDDSLTLFEQDYINKTEVEQHQIDFERAEIQLMSAERDLAIFDEFTFPMTKTERETAVTDAERNKTTAEMRAKSTLRQKEVAVESQESRLTNLEQQLKEVTEEIENFTIKSPSPGIVIYGDPSQPWYRTELKLGANVWGGFTLFTLPDLRVMQVQVQIHEADINKVKVDQPVTVTMDTYPGLVLAGKVTKIATIAGGGDNYFGGGGTEVKKFTVDITLEATDDLKLKPGISAKAEIFIEDRQNVVYVPLQCVFLEEGTHYCYVLGAAGQPERKSVTIGTNNDMYIEVLEGLSESEQVLLYNPSLAPPSSGDTGGGEAADESTEEAPAGADSEIEAATETAADQ